MQKIKSEIEESRLSRNPLERKLTSWRKQKNSGKYQACRNIFLSCITQKLNHTVGEQNEVVRFRLIGNPSTIDLRGHVLIC